MVNIDLLYKSGIISNIDYYFAMVLCKTAKEKDPVMLLTAALTSRASLNGNICLDLDEYAEKTIIENNTNEFDTFHHGSHFHGSSIFSDSGLSNHAVFDSIPLNLKSSSLKFPAKSQWIKSIKNSSITGPSIEFPLVYDGKSRLYLARYYDFQQRIVGNIVNRMGKNSEDIDTNVLNQGLDRLFPEVSTICAKNHNLKRSNLGKNYFRKTNPEETSFKKYDVTSRDDKLAGIRMQKKAAMNAVLKKFSIISGGPGTGKTFICEKIVELLNDQANAASMPPLRIIAAAPTGKAASKLKMGSTIHRMLGTINTTKKFRYNKNNPIPCDAIIIDEASMIDIALMARLLEAVPEDAGLIMLGDKNQLASVEAGAVFGDICRSKMIQDVLTNTEYNFRSGGNSGIDRLAKAVNQGDVTEVEKLLLNKNFDDICFVKINDDNKGTCNTINIHNTYRAYNTDYLDHTHKDEANDNKIFHDGKLVDTQGIIMNKIIKGYLPFIDESDKKKALEKFDTFRILCAHRKGSYGTDYFNAITKNFLLLHKKKEFHSKNIVYKKPVMINVNDYNKNLFNGDTGIALRLNNGTTRVFFKDVLMEQEKNNSEYNEETIADNENSGLKSFLLSDLPSHEDAFAITVHKSQGSEFDHVLFVLPAKLSPVVTKELLYTGITRAKKKITIAGTMEIIKEAVRCPVHRSSAITELIDRQLPEN